MKKNLFVILLMLLIIILGLVLYQVLKVEVEEGKLISASPTQKPIGSDQDEHGCLIAAGYSWCEVKQK